MNGRGEQATFKVVVGQPTIASGRAVNIAKFPDGAVDMASWQSPVTISRAKVIPTRRANFDDIPIPSKPSSAGEVRAVLDRRLKLAHTFQNKRKVNSFSLNDGSGASFKGDLSGDTRTKFAVIEQTNSSQFRMLLVDDTYVFRKDLEKVVKQSSIQDVEAKVKDEEARLERQFSRLIKKEDKAEVIVPGVLFLKDMIPDNYDDDGTSKAKQKKKSRKDDVDDDGGNLDFDEKFDNDFDDFNDNEEDKEETTSVTKKKASSEAERQTRQILKKFAGEGDEASESDEMSEETMASLGLSKESAKVKEAAPQTEEAKSLHDAAAVYVKESEEQMRQKNNKRPAPASEGAPPAKKARVGDGSGGANYPSDSALDAAIRKILLTRGKLTVKKLLLAITKEFNIPTSEGPEFAKNVFSRALNRVCRQEKIRDTIMVSLREDQSVGASRHI